MITKINEDFNYKFHGVFDISQIAEHLAKYSDEWFVNVSRQTISEVHKETHSVFVYNHAAEWTESDPYNLEINESQKEMQELLKPIIESLESVHDGSVGKCLFIKLPPQKTVGAHTDKGEYLGAARRHHIAIETNKDVLFFVDGEPKNMQVGECWEINNSKMHAVSNLGSTDRIHLLFDVMPNKFIKESVQ